MATIRITKNKSEINGTFTLPSSKSESNRALLIKALANQDISIKNLSEADDTLLLNRCLRMVQTCGVSGIPLVVNVDHAGTAMRFLTAYLSIKDGKWLLKGSERMHQRPVQPLVEALKMLGAEIKYVEKEGFPPLLIQGKNLQGGRISLNASISSQYISALLMIAPMLENGLMISLEGVLISRPYLEMTIKMMAYFGVKVDFSGNKISISCQEYIPKEFRVSPDWSAASYAYGLLALAEKGKLFIPGLKADSLQGDRVLSEVYRSFGVESVFTDDGLTIRKTSCVLKLFEYDFIKCPDIAQTVIATCVGLGIEGRFKGLKSLRIKETDRIAKMDDEMSVFGYRLIEENNEWLLKKFSEVDYQSVDHVFKTYNDHRMAMAVAPLVMKTGKIEIEDKDVVSKSFPAFWQQFENLGFGMNIF